MTPARTTAVVALALALAAGTGMPAASQELFGGMGGSTQAEVEPGDVNEGRFDATGGIFGDQRIDCLRCHGLEGAGDPSGAFPRLAGQGAWYLYKTLHDFAQGRRQNEVMSPIARTLTDEEMRALSAYYAALPPATAWPAVEADVETLQAGGALAATGNVQDGIPACAGCHGAEGEGRPPIVPSLAAQSASYLEHQLQKWKAGERDGDPMGVMEAIARAMSDEQMRAVSLYYSAKPPVEMGAPVAEVAPPPAQEIEGLAPPYLGVPERADQDRR
ncbi:MAG TPA: c-type cytochrome [Devosiaceae bacterium]|jgi:cytochrome c553|nr:c-type cytochrome [Devosiaceae bacterium]